MANKKPTKAKVADEKLADKRFVADDFGKMVIKPKKNKKTK